MVFIFSNPLLNFPLCSVLVFTSSLSIFITVALDSLSSKLSVSVILFFHLKYILLFCHFLSQSAAMKLGATVIYPGLEGMSLHGSVPLQCACAW